MLQRRLLWLLLAVVVAGCAQNAPFRTGPATAAPVAPHGTLQAVRFLNSKVSHVVIIVQENRSVDDLFQGLPGADTVKDGVNSDGANVPLQPVRLTAAYDIDHEHRAFEISYDGGKLDGFNLVRSNCSGKKCLPKDLRSYGYVPRGEVTPYFAMAQDYGFANRMFQTNSGPSFPAHQYLLSGTSTIAQGSKLRASENPIDSHQHFTGGCNSQTGSLVLLIDENGAENQQAYPCFERPALTDLLEARFRSWRYYQERSGAGLWNAPDAIEHIRKSPTYSQHVITPPSQFLLDIRAGTLANVVWITPTAAASDHAGVTNGSGPSWVASVVNAIGKSAYWDSTAIFVTWDDWGGWYDHVKPPQYNSYELGFRVPLIVVSAYTKKGYISTHQHEFGSILKFTEETFGLGSLGTTDARADDLADFFNFKAKPRPFVPIAAPLGADYFLHQPVSTQDPDDDF